jgi:hypothetical protein
MAKGAIFIRWGFPTPALAPQAMKVFGEATEYWKRKQEERMIDSFESVFLEYYGGDLSGFLLVRGDREKLDKIRRDPEFEHRNIKTAQLVPNFGVIDAFTGEDLQRRVEYFQQVLPELT